MPVRTTVPLAERGFVLVGVVMFILALTILGLSLFALSGYEAQFLGSSMRGSQAFYDAVSGLERSKHVLAATGDKSAVGLSLESIPGLVFASAVQDGESTGAVSWDPTKPITLRVVAKRAAEQRQIVADFTVGLHFRIYRETLNSLGKIFLYQDADEDENVWVEGVVRQNLSDIWSWDGPLDGPYDPEIGGVPEPEVAEFIRHWQMSPRLPPTFQGTFDDTLEFRADTGLYGIFELPSSHQVGIGSRPGFKFSHGDTANELWLELRARGKKPIVWLLPEGGHFAQTVRVTSWDPENCLIIVAGTSVPEDTSFVATTGVPTGLWFEGGINSNVPVFLISSGTIAIDRTRAAHYMNPGGSNFQLAYTSIFARGIYLRGPQTVPDPAPDQQLSHPPAMDDSTLTRLFEHGLLPNTLGGRNRMFTLVHGSFQELAGSD